MASAIITRTYQDHAISYDASGWFNATQAAARFDKEPTAWIRQSDTIEYIAALCERNGKSGFVTEFNKIKDLDSKSSKARSALLRLAKDSGLVKTKAGSPENGGGTWLHPKLAILFARWLDVDFAIWCDEQIDSIVRGKYAWRKLRHAAASSNIVLNDIIQETRSEAGKETGAVHYMSEAKLVNWVAFGEFAGVERDSLSREQLDLLAHLETRNGIMFARGLSYDERKARLPEIAEAWQELRITKMAAKLERGVA